MSARAHIRAVPAATNADPTPSAGPAEGTPLADLALLPALVGARRVPRDADLSARVRALTLGEPTPGGLLVCAGPPPRALPAGCVGVVCREAPPGAGATASVPVLVLAPSTAWAPVLVELAAAVGGDAIGRAAAARQALRQPLLAGRGFSALATVGAQLLGAPTAMLDEHLDRLGEHGLDAAQETALVDAVARARDHGPASVLGSFLADDLPGLTRVRVVGAGEAVGVIAAWLPAPPTAPERAVLDEVAEACALERAREQVRSETESRLLGDLIEELMAGESISRDSLLRRARHLGADLAGGAVAILGKLTDPHDEGRAITDLRLVRRFLQQARATVALHSARALVDWSGGRLLVLLPPGQAAGADDARGAGGHEAQAVVVGRRLVAATGQSVPGLALTLAVSRFTGEPERLGAALEEARLALTIGERLGRIGEVVTFEETGTYKLLFQIFADRPAELTAFYEQTLAPLVAYDEQYQTELVGTLSTYLGHDCNLAVTAGTLFTHRHTVRYRLDRIAELSGLDISKTDDREKLSLGLKAMRLLGRRVAAAPEGSGRRGRGGSSGP